MPNFRNEQPRNGLEDVAYQRRVGLPGVLEVSSEDFTSESIAAPPGTAGIFGGCPGSATLPDR